MNVNITQAATPNCSTTLDVSGNVNCAVTKAAPVIATFNALGQHVQNTSPYTPLLAPVSISAGGMTATTEQETGYVH